MKTEQSERGKAKKISRVEVVCTVEWTRPGSFWHLRLIFLHLSPFFLSHSCLSCNRWDNLPLNPEQSVSHTHTHPQTLYVWCVCVWMDEQKNKMMGVRSLRKLPVADTHTQTCSAASIEHQEINLLPYRQKRGAKRRKYSLTPRRQFLSPKQPYLIPLPLALSILCLLLSLSIALPFSQRCS